MGNLYIIVADSKQGGKGVCAFIRGAQAYPQPPGCLCLWIIAQSWVTGLPCPQQQGKSGTPGLGLS